MCVIKKEPGVRVGACELRQKKQEVLGEHGICGCGVSCLLERGVSRREAEGQVTVHGEDTGVWDMVSK